MLSLVVVPFLISGKKPASFNVRLPRNRSPQASPMGELLHAPFSFSNSRTILATNGDPLSFRMVNPAIRYFKISNDSNIITSTFRILNLSMYVRTIGLFPSMTMSNKALEQSDLLVRSINFRFPFFGLAVQFAAAAFMILFKPSTKC